MILSNLQISGLRVQTTEGVGKERALLGCFKLKKTHGHESLNLLNPGHFETCLPETKAVFGNPV